MERWSSLFYEILQIAKFYECQCHATKSSYFKEGYYSSAKNITFDSCTTYGIKIEFKDIFNYI